MEGYFKKEMFNELKGMLTKLCEITVLVRDLQINLGARVVVVAIALQSACFMFLLECCMFGV